MVSPKVRCRIGREVRNMRFRRGYVGSWSSEVFLWETRGVGKTLREGKIFSLEWR